MVTRYTLDAYDQLVEGPDGYLVMAGEHDDEIARLTAEIKRLQESFGRVECVHCGDSDTSTDHWERCEKHPARVEVERLRRERDCALVLVDATRDELIHNIATTDLFDDNPSDDTVRDWAELIIRLAQEIDDTEDDDGE